MATQRHGFDADVPRRGYPDRGHGRSQPVPSVVLLLAARPTRRGAATGVPEQGGQGRAAVYRVCAGLIVGRAGHGPR